MDCFTVAHPGFQVGGVDLVGGVDSRGGYVSKILYVEMKESGLLGGRAPGTPPLDPPMCQLVYYEYQLLWYHYMYMY